VVVRDSQILYERYSFGLGKRNTLLGYSVSKSLTALADGRAIFDGHIQSIDEPLKKYVPYLSGASWGEASVKDVLRMSSGAYKTEPQFDGHKSRELQQSICTVIAEGTMTTNFMDLIKAHDDKLYTAGSVFN
jgi:CubicO group peptidase (beta-lactamase class C family)